MKTEQITAIEGSESRSRLKLLRSMACPPGKEFAEFRFGARVEMLQGALTEREVRLAEIRKEDGLPVEARYLQRVAATISASREMIRHEIHCHESSRRRRERYQARMVESNARVTQLREKYPVELSVAAFQEAAFWRTEHGMAVPRLAIFNIDAPDFRVSSTCDRVYGRDIRALTGHGLPPFLRRCFYRFHRSCVESLSPGATISAEFDGAIPRDVRAKIAAAKTDFPGSIYLIAEVPDLKLDIHTTLPPGDPLVVGAAERRLFLIADFDTTSLEREFLFKLPGEERT